MVSIGQKNYYGLNCGNSKNREFRVNARTDGGGVTRMDAQHFSPNLGLKLFTLNIEAWIFFGLWVLLADMQKSIQPGKLTYVGNWYYYFGQRKLLKPPTMAL
jgi:hypothetical protein